MFFPFKKLVKRFAHYRFKQSQAADIAVVAIALKNVTVFMRPNRFLGMAAASICAGPGDQLVGDVFGSADRQAKAV